MWSRQGAAATEDVASVGVLLFVDHHYLGSLPHHGYRSGVVRKRPLLGVKDSFSYVPAGIVAEESKSCFIPCVQVSRQPHCAPSMHLFRNIVSDLVEQYS